MKYQVYRSGGQYRWRLIAANGRIIAGSGESYHNKSDCLAGINLVKNSGAAPVDDLTQTQVVPGSRY
jgi:uncharacterized protein YegP (UPF0339 family)